MTDEALLGPVGAGGRAEPEHLQLLHRQLFHRLPGQKLPGDSPAGAFILCHPQLLTFRLDVGPVHGSALLLLIYVHIHEGPQTHTVIGIMLEGMGGHVDVMILVREMITEGSGLVLDQPGLHILIILHHPQIAVELEQGVMELHVIHGIFVVDVMMSVMMALGVIPSGQHILTHLLPTGGVEQDILIGHLPHLHPGIQILEHTALQGHIPDPHPLHGGTDLLTLDGQKKVPAQRPLPGLLPDGPDLRCCHTLQGGGGHCLHRVGLCQQEQLPKIHALQPLRLRFLPMKGTMGQIYRPPDALRDPLCHHQVTPPKVPAQNRRTYPVLHDIITQINR